MQIVYESGLQWDPERPDTLIITCVDGRWYRHFQEFARVHLAAGERTDYVAVPGGIEPMTLSDRVPKDFNFFRRRITSVIEAHGTERIVAIAHQDARGTAPGCPVVGDRSKRSPDCRFAARGVVAAQDVAGVRVETYFAHLSGTSPEKVRFETV